MTDSEFMNHAEALLRAVEQQCDQFNDETEADIDNQRVGGMITLTFPNRTQIVINLQKPLHEVWLASRTGGYHTKGQGEFWGRLRDDASAQAGLALHFSS